MSWSTQIQALLDKYGLAAVLFAIILLMVLGVLYTGWKRWWEWGHVSAELRDENERLRAALDRERESRATDVRTWQMVAFANNQQVNAALKQQERLVQAVENVVQPSQEK